MGVCFEQRSYLYLLVDGPRFLPGQVSHVYTWAGQHAVIYCYIHAEPMASVDWFSKGFKLQNNDTFHVVSSGGNSSLEVGELLSSSLFVR